MKKILRIMVYIFAFLIFISPIIATKQSLELINGEDMDELGLDGTGLKICIVDSGIDMNKHGDKVLGTYCKCRTLEGRGCCNGLPASTDVTDVQGHGTKMADIILSLTPEVKFYIAKVVENRDVDVDPDFYTTHAGYTLSNYNYIPDGITWCKENTDADIISVSIERYGEYSSDETLSEDYDKLLFISAGNNGLDLENKIGYSDRISAIAGYTDVISVGSVHDYNEIFGDNEVDKISSFSNRGPNLDILAPGAKVSTSIASHLPIFGKYFGDRGTSLATPIVSAAAAIILQKNSSLNFTQVEDVLEDTGAPITDDESGLTFPRIDIGAAIAYLSGFFILDAPTGSVAKGQTWQTSLEVPNIGSKELVVDLNWKRSGDLDLSLELPNESVISAIEKHPERIVVNNAPVGIYKIKVYGDSWEKGISRDFEVHTNIDSQPVITDIAGIDFSDIQINFVANCDTNTKGGLTVNLRGTKAGEDDVILDTAGKSSMSTDAFLAGLIIPNQDQWISLYYSGADYGGRFGETEAGQRMFAMDEKLKWDFWNITWPLLKDMTGVWKEIVNSSDYNETLMRRGFNSFPIMQARAWIEPDTFTINGSSCGDMYVEDVNLKLRVEVMRAVLDNTSTLNSFEWYYMSSLLDEWKGELENELSNYTTYMEDLLNNDGNYSDLRRVYASIATARWYKEETPRHIALFGDLMDSNDLEAVNIAVDDNKSVWDDRSQQFLFKFYHTSFRPEEDENSYIRYWGGIKFRYIFPSNLGDVNEYTLELMDNATIYEFASDDGNQTVYYSSFLQPNKQDFAPISLWFDNTEPDVGEPVNITVTVENKGTVDSGLFDVYLGTEFTYPNGYKGYDFIKAIYDNPSLSHGNVTHVSWTWTPTRQGINNISAEVWPYLDDINRHNNIMTETIDVKDPFPTATIDAPLNHENFLWDDNITFIGSGYDNKDGSLDDTSLNWSSDIDGWLGTGSVVYKNLSLGKHIITLTVNDSNEHFSTEQIIISVTPSKPPFVKILSPINNSLHSEADRFYFEGEAIDTEDGLLDNYSLEWSSSLDGFLSYGSSFSTTGLSPGNNTIYLKATDSSNVETVVYHNLTIDAAYPSVLTSSPENESEYYYTQDPTFEATATDPQEGDITSNLIWTSIIDDVIGFGSGFTKSLSTGIHNIIASIIDKTGFTAQQEINFTVHPPLAPDVSIITPRKGQSFTHGDIIHFRKIANDPETGEINNLSVEWNASTESYSWNGSIEIINTSSWSDIGGITIRLSAYDTDSMYSSTYTNITITSASATINIITPSGQIFAEGENITFNGEALDLEDGDISSNLVWYSDISGHLGAGNNFDLKNLSKGTHRITAEVVDSDNINTTKSTNIMIAGPGQMQLNMLSTGETIKNLTYTAAANQTVYVRIHNDGNVTDASLTLTGYSK